VFDKLFSWLFERIHNHKRWTAASIGILVVTASFGLNFVSFDNNFELMLPGDETIYRSIRFLRESNLSDKVIVSLTLKSSEHALEDLVRAVERLEASLTPPFVSDVVSGVSSVDVMDEVFSFLKYVPQLVDAKTLAQIDRRLSPAGIRATLDENFRQLLTPASSLLMPMIRSDPLRIKHELLRSLQELSSSMGMGKEIAIEQGHFVSRDGDSAILILETPVSATNTDGCRDLIDYLHKQLQVLPDYIEYSIVSAHLHTLSNEDVMKRDIRLVVILASAAFFLLFLIGFRDSRTVLIFLFPMVSILFSINLSYLCLRSLSYFVIGMGMVVAGIAIDYGIHVYMAIRTAQGDVRNVRRVAKPVVTGALTTAGVFASFLFSSVQGYRQFGLFSIISILLCLAFALFILPHFLVTSPNLRRPGVLGPKQSIPSPASDRRRVLGWMLVMITAALISTRLSFQTDVTQLDGTDPEILQTEKNLLQLWGMENRPAVLIVSGETLEDALYRNERVYREAVEEVGRGNFTSLASVWPSKQTRNANASAWTTFWQQDREARLKRLLSEQGRSYDFSEDAFSPFFEHLYDGTIVDEEPEGLALYETLKKRFVVRHEGGYQILSLFPDKEEHIAALEALCHLHPGTFLVSRNVLSHAISNSVSDEIVYLSALAALFIPLLTCLLLRNIRLAILALVPVLTGIIIVIAMIPVLGMSMNPPGIISAMVVVGLCIDYGIFMVYTCRYQLQVGTRTAILLSVLTTLIGAGGSSIRQPPRLVLHWSNIGDGSPVRIPCVLDCYPFDV